MSLLSVVDEHDFFIGSQQMNEAPADWLTEYNGFRPHRSLNILPLFLSLITP
ncbi:MAG: hypothetical protein R1F54_05565 [Candidatus Zeuxoniibacter abyssi]|nr:MAG: hypothetical protein R1F54_05565 [Candidatus Persebacteraceae bacterium AB1(2)]